ncbi:serine/threonine-protein kinase, partial [Pseudofrankia saprophytica]|uniref:serine/threonine-protein kinase n=1 Tax=Pseudofrankia saprophytica TaxID=298655 RepID=UPI0012FF2B9C
MSGEGRSASGAGRPAVFPPGTVVGRRYRLDEVIGEGGMGVVHRATDQIMRRTVAIKQVRLPAGAGMAVAQARERVLREARAAGRVHHPGAVGVLDVIDDGELPWIVMELVEGDALSALIERDGGLPVERVAQIGISLAYALDAAHRLGVIHRDVKPSNVIVTPDGQARLTDFGIAVSQGDPRLTSTGEVIGSPAYLSPERAQGDAGGPACDVWGLGGTLYAAVEGEPPFGGATPVDILTSVVEGLIRPPRHAGPLWPILRTMLAQREADRPSLTVVRSRLRDLSGETSSRTGGTQPRTPRPAASRPAAAGLTS